MNVCLSHLKVLVIVCLTAFSNTDLFSQDKKAVDSLINIVGKGLRDTAEVNALDELSSLYENGDLKKGIFYAKESFALAEKLNFKSGMLRAINQEGNILNNCGQYDQAIKNYEKVIELANAWGFSNLVARANANMGNAHRFQGNYGKAIEAYLIALKQAEKDNDVVFKGGVLNFIGMVYEAQAELKKAQEYYRQSLKVYVDLKDSSEMAKPLMDIGNTYAQLGDFNTALSYYKKALSIYEKENNIDGISSALGNIGITFFESGNLQESYKAFKTSLDMAEQRGDLNAASISLLNLANFYGRTKNYNMAIECLNKALPLAIKTKSKPQIKDIYFVMSEIHALAGNFTEAYDFHVLYSDYKDSILNENSSKQVEQLQAVFESEKKDAELQKRKAEIDKQTTQKIMYAGGLILAVLLLFFAIRGYVQKQKSNKELSLKNKIIEAQKHEVEVQKELVEEKQKEILDSITYARRIQRALLPKEKYIDKNLKRIVPKKD